MSIQLISVVAILGAIGLAALFLLLRRRKRISREEHATLDLLLADLFPDEPAQRK